MSHKKVMPIIATPKEQLKDDVETMLVANGFSLNDLASYERQQQYRKEYSLRPHVVEKRKQYAKQRYLKMKALRELLKSATTE